MQHNTLQQIHYNTIQYNTIQYNTIQTIQHNTLQQIHYNTIQYSTIQYNTIQYNTIQYNTIQYNTIILLRGWLDNSRAGYMINVLCFKTGYRYIFGAFFKLVAHTSQTKVDPMRPGI